MYLSTHKSKKAANTSERWDRVSGIIYLFIYLCQVLAKRNHLSNFICRLYTNHLFHIDAVTGVISTDSLVLLMRLSSWSGVEGFSFLKNSQNRRTLKIDSTFVSKF